MSRVFVSKVRHYTYQYIDLDRPKGWFDNEHGSLPYQFSRAVGDAITDMVAELPANASERRSPQEYLVVCTRAVEDILYHFFAKDADQEGITGYEQVRLGFPTSITLDQAMRFLHFSEAVAAVPSIPADADLATLFMASALRDADEALVAFYEGEQDELMDLLQSAVQGLAYAQQDRIDQQHAKASAEQLQDLKSELARRAASSRHRLTYAVRDKALELFAELTAKREQEGKAKLSKLQATKAILKAVMEYADQIKKPLSIDRAEKTVYDWIRASDK